VQRHGLFEGSILTKLLLGHLHKRIHRRAVLLTEGFLPLLDIHRPVTSFCGLLLLPFKPICIPLGDSRVKNNQRSVINTFRTHRVTGTKNEVR